MQACRRAFPDAYIRLVGFDSVRQVQVAGLLVNRPSSVRDYQSPSTRSVA
ncbi:ribulose bisphosphate carboxylase small subunit [Klebsiella pneumoniae]